jgi:predicted nucleic acid-binding Zn finger protein
VLQLGFCSCADGGISRSGAEPWFAIPRDVDLKSASSGAGPRSATVAARPSHRPSALFEELANRIATATKFGWFHYVFVGKEVDRILNANRDVVGFREATSREVLLR